VKSWQDIAEAPLKHRNKLLRLQASGFYNLGYSRTHQINLVDRGVSTIVPFLVEGNPRVLVETMFANLKPWAYITQLAMNFLIEKNNFAEEVLIPVATNSMFGAGITRTFKAYDRKISYNDELIKVGSPKVIIIDDAAYIGDCAAKTRNDVTVEGDIYRLPTDYAKDLFSDNADYISADCKLMEKYSAEEISKPDFNRNKLSVRDYTTFIDLYLYDERVIVTIMPEGKKAKILRTVEWDGPSRGPYNYLGYRFFPDSTIPLPPAWNWHDLDVTVNIIADKMREQAECQKDLIAYTAPAEASIEEARKAPNLGTIKFDSLEDIKPFSLGGMNETNLNWFNVAQTEFLKTGVNPVLSGSGPSSPTYGQEKLVYNNAARVVNNMYTRFQDFTTEVIKNWAWLFWTSPLEYVPVVRELPGVAQLPAVFSNADKVGDFYDFIFKIVPYSTQRKSPELRGQELMQFMAQWVLPSMQLASAQGAQVDIPTATKILAQYFGFDSFNQIYKTAVPQPTDAVVNYRMLPLKNKSNQVSDAFGTTLGNKEAQSSRKETEEKTIGEY
jgi:hypothetical protein